MTELFGTTRPLDEAARRRRYPRGRADYLDRFGESTRRAVDDGFLLAADAPEIDALGRRAWPEV
jgi:hypothetical protein